MTGHIRLLCGIFVLLLLCGCAGQTRTVVPVATPIPPGPTSGASVGDIVTAGSETARVEEVYKSALGQVCRKLLLIGQDNLTVTECYDGSGWHVIREIAGRSPVGK